jgi:nucleotide-binding universal stress UspA family protein
MFKHVLIATDGSDLAGKAVSKGLELAKQLSAAATAVTVTEAWPPIEMAAEVERGKANPIDDYEARLAEWANGVLAKVTESARAMGVSCETVHVADQHPADGIIATSRNKDCDLIVMASHGRRGVRKMLLGSVANEVLAQSSVPVLVYR